MTDRAGPLYLPRDRFQVLLDALQAARYRCTAPVVRDGAIVFDTVTRAASLPRGVGDRQAPAQYRLEAGDHGRFFAWANGPQALKPMVFAPREALWRVARGDDGRLRFEAVAAEPAPTAFIGARACDLAALRMLDRHYGNDPHYRARRRALLIVAVNCTHPADTCFCASTGDGPRASAGFDMALDELDDGFVVYARGAKGRAVAARLDLAPATRAQQRAGRRASRRAAERQTRALPSRNLRDALFANLHHPRWDDVAQRCLSCGNCTQVCPTCFCHSQSEQPSMDGGGSAHYREWDSCHTAGHSYIHGAVIRPDTLTRYRQWLTHKLGGWHDQFGRSGCVGCGRCITWCPTGIDLTEEAAAICGPAAP